MKIVLFMLLSMFLFNASASHFYELKIEKGDQFKSLVLDSPTYKLRAGSNTEVEKDGGSSIAEIKLNIKSSQKLKNSIPVKVEIDQGPLGLGRNIKVSSSILRKDGVLLRKLPSTKISIEEKGKTEISGNLDIDIVEARSIINIIKQRPTFENISPSGVDLVINGSLFDVSSFKIYTVIWKKEWFSWKEKAKGVLGLVDLDVKYLKGKTIIHLPFKVFDYLKKEKSGKYRMTARIFFEDYSVFAPEKSNKAYGLSLIHK